MESVLSGGTFGAALLHQRCKARILPAFGPFSITTLAKSVY